MLNYFQSLPSSVKVILGSFIVGFILAGLLNISYFPSILTTLNDEGLVDVTLLVQTEDNQPIEGAEVQFNSKGAPTTKYTTKSGYAEIKVPDRESVEINITKEGYEILVEIINLEVDPDTNRKFKLKSNKLSKLELKIDYQHYTAENEVFPLTLSLMKPDLNSPLIQKILQTIDIDSVPLVARNDVFNNINKFINESGNQEVINVTSGVQIASQDKLDDTKVLVNREEGVGDFSLEYTNNSIKFLQDDFCENLSYAPVLGQFNTDDDSKYTFLMYNHDQGKVLGNIIQYPKLSDIVKYGQKHYYRLSACKNRDVWIKNIIGNNPDFRGLLGFNYPFVIDIDEFESFGCGGNGAIFSIEKIASLPYVKFIDLVNNNQEPVRINSITYDSIKKSPYELTVADQRSSIFESSDTWTQELNISLKPGNNFLIPIEFGFNAQYIEEYYHNLGLKYFDKSKLVNLKKIYVTKALSKPESKKFSNTSDYKQQNRLLTTPITLSQEFINSTSSLSELSELIPNRIAVGSILNVKSIKINGKSIDILPPSDEPTVYISTYLQAGSCPYLVVYDPKQDGWLELGTILYARKNKSLQQEELHSLGDSVSKIRIEEREAEITYIDALSIVYTDPETEKVEEVIYPMTELQKVDEDYFSLHQGEALEIDLEQFIPANASDVKLKINGYYQVLQEELS
ncbi:MAG: hypothetical protein F6K49_21180 [Moorea sp. SIO3I6]|nr:hypothetical protein [Moorena sp. SIO3I6]